jgi:hypothetical protein
VELLLRWATAWAQWGLRERELEVWGSSPGAGQPFIGRRQGGGGRVPSMASIEGALILSDGRHRLPED